ncbi:Uncharacterized protein GBIM_15232 [Gryllus bimaculatus]|nr:Uncharacterized protein GBIM_15232 [Gryllus bimaculatus]
MALKGLEFARALLEKYGWKDGKGLGRNEDGMAHALKPKCKFDKAGMGHNGLSEQFTSQWWEKAYNKVAKNISVIQDKSDIQIQQEDREELFKTKDARPFSMYNPIDYNAFVKTHVLTGEGVVEVAEPMSNPSTSSEKDAPLEARSCLTDEEIFQACGGRTVHKGARHGLNLNGKLARIERQEQELLLKYQSQPSSEASDFEPSGSKKKKKEKIKSILKGTTIGIESDCVLTFERSKKKKDCRNVLDDSLEISKRKKRKNNIETEFVENPTTFDIPLNYTCSSFLIEDNTDPQYKTSKKKKNQESEKIEDVNTDVTDTSTPEPHKKKKKNIQNDAQHSEIINPSLSDRKKKKKKKKSIV